MDNRITKLINILHKQIAWYHENKEDEGFIYDEMYNQFNNLSRGDFVEIIAILLSEDK